MSTQKARARARRTPAIVPVDDNPRAVAGANNPPEPVLPEPWKAPPAEPVALPLTSFQVVEKRINDLYDEARQGADGAPVDSPEIAAYFDNLLGMLRAAHADAEALRKAEVAPLDTAKAEIQARYAPLTADTTKMTGKTIRAASVIKNALAPWLQKLADDKARAEEMAHAEAEAKRLEAEAAIRATSGTTNLVEREAAEDLVRDAKRAEVAVNRIARATTTAGGTMGKRSATLRTVWTPTVTDAVLALRHYWQEQPDAMVAWVLSCAEADVRRGVRQIPGITITQSQQVV